MIDSQPNRVPVEKSVQTEPQLSQMRGPIKLSARRIATVAAGGFWIRFVAFCVDVIIVLVLFCLLKLVLQVSVFRSVMNPEAFMSNPDAMQVQMQLLNWGVILGWIFLYCGWFYKNKGATPGKMIFGLRVVHAETGSNIEFWRAFLRETLGRFAGAIILMSGFIMAGCRTDKRALHDLIANTQVIRRSG